MGSLRKWSRGSNKDKGKKGKSVVAKVAGTKLSANAGAVLTEAASFGKPRFESVGSMKEWKFRRLVHGMIYLWNGTEYVVESAEAGDEPDEHLAYTLFTLEEWGYVDEFSYYIDDDGYIAESYGKRCGFIDDLVETGKEAPALGFLGDELGYEEHEF